MIVIPYVATVLISFSLEFVSVNSKRIPSVYPVPHQWNFFEVAIFSDRNCVGTFFPQQIGKNERCVQKCIFYVKLDRKYWQNSFLLCDSNLQKPLNVTNQAFKILILVRSFMAANFHNVDIWFSRLVPVQTMPFKMCQIGPQIKFSKFRNLLAHSLDLL